MPTLKELSVLYAKKQPKMVENITEEAPILRIVPFEKASHDLWNVYEETTEITGPGFVNLDAPLPAVGAKSELKKVDLSIMGGEAIVGEDKARLHGGPAAYFAKQTPSILRKAGMTTEVAILYSNFRAYALANSRKLNAGGSSNVNHCILAVRFVTGETTGLYSPKGFDNGAVLDIKTLNGGALMKVKESRNGQSVEFNGYAVRYKGYFGMQLANKDTVAGIFNVDRISATKKIPTVSMVDDLLDMVRASSNTFLFMHPKIRTALYEHKNTPLTMNVYDKRFDDRIDFWHDVPIITSYNFLDGTEANVSF